MPRVHTTNKELSRQQDGLGGVTPTYSNEVYVSQKVQPTVTGRREHLLRPCNVCKYLTNRRAAAEPMDDAHTCIGEVSAEAQADMTIILDR